MQQQSHPSIEFSNLLHTYTLRMLALCQESQKFNMSHCLPDLDIGYSKLLYSFSAAKEDEYQYQDMARDKDKGKEKGNCKGKDGRGGRIEESLIMELTEVEIKSDQHCLLVMTLLYDLGRWVIDWVGDAMSICRWKYPQKQDQNQDTREHVKELLECPIQISTVECIISQSITLIKQQKKHQTLLTKNNQLIRILMQLIPCYLPVAVIKTKYSVVNGNSNGSNYGGNGGGIDWMLERYMEIFELMKVVKEGYGNVSKEEIKKNYNRSVENSIKALGNLLTFIILQTPPKTIHNLTHTKSYSKHITLLSQILHHIVTYLQFLFNCSMEDLYKICQILNTINLANPIVPMGSNTSGNININININNTVIPMAQLGVIFPVLGVLYGGNIGEVVISRLKIVRIVMDVLVVLGRMEVCPMIGLLAKQSTDKQKDKIIIALSVKLAYHEQILHKTAHMLIKINGYVKLCNYYILGMILGIYDKMQGLLLKRDTNVPLYLYTHLVMNNVRLLMEWNCSGTGIGSSSSNGNFVLIPNFHLHTLAYTTTLTSQSPNPQHFSQLSLLQILLSQIVSLFQHHQALTYFLYLYDWNFMQENVVTNTIKYLYEYVEDCGNEGKPEYEIFRKCIIGVGKGIQGFLGGNGRLIEEVEKQANFNQAIKQEGEKLPVGSSFSIAAKKQRKQFFQLKHKQYLNIVSQINKKPKQLFKILKQYDQNSQSQLKQDFIQKCIRIVKKSNHIEQKAMLDFMGANNGESEQILVRYVESFLGKGSGRNGGLEQFLRYVISNFFLAGESQQIVRFLDKVTEQYYKHQSPSSHIFKTRDPVYTFANAIILLNADQHNPKNPNRMSLESFSKMCDKINNGQSLPPEIIRETYKNIRESEIHTFRDRYRMEKISLECWMEIVGQGQGQGQGVGYYDEEMAEICGEDPGSSDGNGLRKYNTIFREYANQLLMSVIDEKQTQKLQQMIQHFSYSDQKFSCEILEKLRTISSNPNKNHIPMHALQKIYQLLSHSLSPSPSLSEPTKKIDDKTVSYCWLAVGVIENFAHMLPYSKIVEYLVRAWRVGYEGRDWLAVRQGVELRGVRRCVREWRRKESRKSIMEMFSKFLSSKDSETDQQKQLLSPSSQPNRHRPNITNCSYTVLQILMRSQDSRARGAETVLLGLRCEEARRFEEFVGLLWIIFYLVGGDGSVGDSSGNGNEGIVGQGNIGDHSQISSQCEKIVINLLEDFFCITKPHQIGSRIESLKTKSQQKYQLVYTYTQFSTLKIFFTQAINRLGQNTNSNPHTQQQQKKITKIYEKCTDFVRKINSQLLEQLIKILDVSGVSFEILVADLKIPEEIINALKIAIKSYNLKLKYLSGDGDGKEKEEKKGQQLPNSTGGLIKSKSVPDKSEESMEQAEKYMKQLMQSKARSEPDVPQNQNLEANIEQELRRELEMVENTNEAPVMDSMGESEKIEEDEDKNQLEKQQKKQIQDPKTVQREQPQKLQQQKPEQKDKQDQQKKSVKSNQSNEEIGLPIYML